MYVLDLQAIGLIIAGGAVVGLIVGLMAGMMLRGGEDPRPPKRGLTRILTLWRRKTDAVLWVQMDEQAAASPDDLDDEERAALERLTMEMFRWLRQEPGEVAPSPAAAEAAPPQASAPAAAQPPPVAAADSAAQPQAAPAPRSGAPRPPLPSVSPGASQPSINPLKPFQEALWARKQPSGVSPLPSASIAAQVDEILQEMLAGTVLEARGIRLMELPGEGMVVMVGMEKFAAVDEVPYDDVRRVLKVAVARWEEKMFGE